MKELIDKAALVAEIKRRIKELQDLFKENDKKLDSFQKTAIHLCIDECKVILDILDTLEVKEAVDAEIVEVEDNNNSIYAYTHLEICTDEDLSKICKDGDKVKVIIIK